MEYCEGGTIRDIMMVTKSPLNEDEAKGVISYTLLALDKIHSHNILHRVVYCFVECELIFVTNY